MQDSKSKFKSRVANLSLRFAVFCTYVALGMVIIVAIEKTDVDEISSKKAELLADLQASIMLKYNLSEGEFKSLADAIYDAKSPAPLKWTHGRGFSFAIQLVTTIGYGNITPITNGGKVFCIFFALFGIPITVLMLSTVGGEIFNFEKYIIKKIETRLLKRQNVTHGGLKCLIIAFATILSLILIGSAITASNHGYWTLLDSVYCWFITFTTVGFGDYIPSHGNEKNFADGTVIMFGIYILLGLCAMSNLLNIIGEFASLGIFQIQFHCNTDCEKETGSEDNKDNANHTETTNNTDSNKKIKCKDNQHKTDLTKL